ncbi:unnamed protein product, partial [Rotaria sordida]
MYWFLMIGLFLLINNSIGCKRPSLSQIAAQRDFRLEKFLGQWHQIKYYTNEKNHNPSDSWVDYSQFFALDNCINRHVLAFGRARLPNGKECFSFGPSSIFAYDGAKMIVETDDINKNTKVNWPYFILKTDYTHYALTYTCLTKGATRYDPCTEEIVEVFSRTTTLAKKYLTELDNYIKNILCVDLTKFEQNIFGEKLCFPDRDDRFLITMDDYRKPLLSLWSTHDYTNLLNWQDESSSIYMNCLAWNPMRTNEFCLDCSNDFVNGQIPLSISEHTKNSCEITLCVYLISNSHLVLCSTNSSFVTCWNTRRNLCLLHWKADSNEICYMTTNEFQLDDEIISGSFDNTFSIDIVGTSCRSLWYICWTTQRTKIRLVVSHTDRIMGVIPIEDTHIVTSSVDDTITIYQLEDRNEILRFDTNGLIISDGTLHIFNLLHGQIVLKLHPHTPSITAINVPPN